MQLPSWKRKALARKSIRKPYRKRLQYKRKSLAPGRGTLRYKGQPGIADRAVIKLRYRDNYVFTAPAGNYFTQRAWLLNSIYDPDNTGIGHQPLTYDQWSLFYRSYRVFKADVTIQLANQESEAVQMGWTVQPLDNAVFASDSAFEQPHTFTKILGGINGQNRTIIKRTVYMPRMIGQTPTQYKSNEDVSAVFGFNPIHTVYGILFGESIDGITVPNVSVNMDIVFHVELFDRKEMPISDNNSALKSFVSNTESKPISNTTT